jgi:hypothetical protein
MISAVRAAPKSGFHGVRLGCGDIHALKRCFILTISLSLLDGPTSFVSAISVCYRQEVSPACRVPRDDGGFFPKLSGLAHRQGGDFGALDFEGLVAIVPFDGIVVAAPGGDGSGIHDGSFPAGLNVRAHGEGLGGIDRQDIAGSHRGGVAIAIFDKIAAVNFHAGNGGNVPTVDVPFRGHGGADGECGAAVGGAGEGLGGRRAAREEDHLVQGDIQRPVAVVPFYGDVGDGFGCDGPGKHVGALPNGEDVVAHVEVGAGNDADHVCGGDIALGAVAIEDIEPPATGVGDGGDVVAAAVPFRGDLVSLSRVIGKGTGAGGEKNHSEECGSDDEHHGAGRVGGLTAICVLEGSGRVKLSEEEQDRVR